MNGITSIINTEKPNIICMQEVTYNIYNIFKSHSWWNSYICSITTDNIHSFGSYFTMICIHKSLSYEHENTNFQILEYPNSLMGRNLLYFICEKQKVLYIYILNNNYPI